jgi:hypothetical protein
MEVHSVFVNSGVRRDRGDDTNFTALTPVILWDTKENVNRTACTPQISFVSLRSHYVIVCSSDVLKV